MLMPRSSQQYCCAYSPLPAIVRLLLSAYHLLPTALCLLVSAFWFPTSSYAQSSTATLSGTVEDQKGALIPGASIALINADQGSQRLATTSSEGTFVFPLLPPGKYSVTATREGFGPVEIRDVALNVNDQVAMRIHLNIGTVSQTVEIVDGASLIDESPAVATVVDRQFVANLPLNGRSFQSLITLTPGVVLTKASINQQGQFSVNGQRANANYFTVDGVSANVGVSAVNLPGQPGAGSLPALSASGGTNNLVSVDALQEFRIQTSTYAPEFGRTPGAQVSIATRSGTNDFHGTLFDYLRNEVFDANDWFANSIPLTAQQVAQGLTKQKRAPLRQNDFGGVFGGPLYLPHFGEGGPTVFNGKNKVFFFLSYEGLRLRQPLVGITTVPSLATRQAAPSAVQPLANLYPRPNGAELGNGLAAFSSSFSNPTTLNATSIRVDGNLSSKLTVFGRYNYAPSDTSGRGANGTTLNTVTQLFVNTQTLTLGATSILTPAISNELRFNYTRNRSESFGLLDDFGGAVVPADSVIFPLNRSSQDALTTFQISGTQQGAIRWGRSPKHLQRQFNVVNNLSWVSGDHQLKFGIDYRRLSPVFRIANYLQTLIFSGVGTPGSPASGTLLSGRLSLANISSQISPQVVLFQNFSAYAQDTWKITSRLTLTYGSRWEVNPPPRSGIGNPPLTLTQVNDPSTFAFAPQGTPLWKTTYGNFAPRIGVSYQLSNKAGRETVVRGGFGLFYDLGEGQASNAFIGSFPFTSTKSSSNVAFPLSAADATPPVPGSAFISSSTLYAFDPELKLPRVFQWNVAFERSLGPNQTLTASYVAAVGRRLLRLETFSNSSTNFPGFVQISKNDATSDYHAGQLQYNRRLSRRLQALASYTWSKSLDMVSDDSVATNRGDKIDPRQDRGPSDFDVRHAFNAAITYNVPIPKTGAVGEAILGNWAIDAFATARSATPVNVTYSRNLGFGNFSFRPDLISGIPLYLDDPNVAGGRRFNNVVPTAAQIAAAGCSPSSATTPAKGPFCTPITARQGTLGRNALRGFSIWQLDFAIRRQFNLTERVKLQFRTEFFNIFNHPNFGDPNGSLTSSLFGTSTTMLGKSLGAGGPTGGFNPLYQVGGSRSIQFALKLSF
jgi:hypothetical protein